MRQELLRRLAIQPFWSFEVILASFVVNVMALGSSLYSIQVLNRYLTMGIDATLYTLTIGVLIALIFEILLRSNRLKLAQKICEIADYRLQAVGISFFGMGEYSNIDRLNLGQRKEIFTGIQTVKQAFGALNLTSIFDVPFCLVFLFVLYLISPFLCGLIFIWILILCTLHLVLQLKMRNTIQGISEKAVQGSNLFQYYILHPESLRSFNCQSHMQKKLSEHEQDELNQKIEFQQEQNISQQLTYLGTMVTTIIIYGIGSREVILGNLDVGTLIGASILSSRAVGNVTKGLQLFDQLVKARYSLGILGALAKQPLELQTGLVPNTVQGVIRFEDVSFCYAGQNNPVFEGLTFEAMPGTITVLKGRNGMGKTTSARLISGLLKPTRGKILVDGLDLSQCIPEWWRRQLIYMPQEPGFFSGTLLENLRVLNPDSTDEEILDVCNQLGLGEFINSQEGGLHMEINAAASQIPRGIKRRLSLARALMGNGKIVILDDPTEAIDPMGCKAITEFLNKFVKQGKVLFITSNDSFIAQAASHLIDLDHKPTPRIHNQLEQNRKPITNHSIQSETVQS